MEQFNLQTQEQSQQGEIRGAGIASAEKWEEKKKKKGNEINEVTPVVMRLFVSKEVIPLKIL